MSQFETSAGYLLRYVAYFYRFYVFYTKYHPLLCLAEASRLGYPFENGASKMAVSVRFLCHLPNEEMAIHFSSTISCLIVERISQVASTRDTRASAGKRRRGERTFV